MVSQAAGAGVSRPWQLLQLTPREIEMEFAAIAAHRQQLAEQADLAAWLTGRYVLLAMHAPKKFPRSPDGVRRKAEQMSPAQIKQVFKDIAAKRGETDGNC